jgi:hypothetical protein
MNGVTFHGPLMVCGFLGTLIGLERAVATQRWLPYIGPFTTGLGGACLLLGIIGTLPRVLFLMGAAWLCGVTAWLLMGHRSASLVVMLAGAAAWFIGNLLWFLDWPIHKLVVWWMSFLLITILAERLELSRVVQPTRRQLGMIFAATGLLLMGLLISFAVPRWGQQLLGTAMIGMAAWLLWFDVARRTVRRPGAPRFIAVCVLTGFVWLGISGSSLAFHGPIPKYGVVYDSTLHAFFLGFVFSMIMGHASIVLPAVLQVELPFHRMAYAPFFVLQGSLITRIIADIFSDNRGHGWSGIVNAIALALFIIQNMTTAVYAQRLTRPKQVATRGSV